MNKGLSEYFSSENLEKFDVVTCLEVAEHVNEPQEFISMLPKFLKPGGLLFVSTISRTSIAYYTIIVMAEDIAGLIPKGTHHYNKFITPEEMKEMIKGSGLDCLYFQGFGFNLSTLDMHECQNLDINYMVKAKKKGNI